MFLPTDPRFDELLSLADRAAGPGLLDSQRPRWRELCAHLLGRVTVAGGGAERRRTIRAAASLPVRLLAPADQAGLVASSVSAGGLALLAKDALPVGTPVRLSIELEGRPAPLEARGEVVWQRGNEAGIAFVDLVQSEREHLEAVAVRAVLAHLAAV